MVGCCSSATDSNHTWLPCLGGVGPSPTHVNPLVPNLLLCLTRVRVTEGRQRTLAFADLLLKSIAQGDQSLLGVSQSREVDSLGESQGGYSHWHSDGGVSGCGPRSREAAGVDEGAVGVVVRVGSGEESRDRRVKQRSRLHGGVRRVSGHGHLTNHI